MKRCYMILLINYLCITFVELMLLDFIYNRLSEPWGFRKVELLEAVGDLLQEKDLKTKKAIAEVLGPTFAIFCCHPTCIAKFSRGLFGRTEVANEK